MNSKAEPPTEPQPGSPPPASPRPDLREPAGLGSARVLRGFAIGLGIVAVLVAGRLAFLRGDDGDQGRQTGPLIDTADPNAALLPQSPSAARPLTPGVAAGEGGSPTRPDTEDGRGAIAGNGNPDARLRTLSCPGKSSETASMSDDGRFFGHLPYRDAPAARLARPPDGFASAGCGRLHADAASGVARMMAAMRADDPELAARLVGLSCFRSIARQRAVFCNGVNGSLAVRAQVSAPPGFSEHHTGLAIDFGDRKMPGCHLEACFAMTPVGKWLLDNAHNYGFELSFPAGNDQGVTYEPWHWRYVGGSAGAVFADARARYAAGAPTTVAASRDRTATSTSPQSSAGLATELEQTRPEPEGAANPAPDQQPVLPPVRVPDGPNAPDTPNVNGIQPEDTGVIPETPPDRR